MPKALAKSGRNPADPYQHCRPRAHHGRAELIWAVVASSAEASWESHHSSAADLLRGRSVRAEAFSMARQI